MRMIVSTALLLTTLTLPAVSLAAKAPALTRFVPANTSGVVVVPRLSRVVGTMSRLVRQLGMGPRLDRTVRRLGRKIARKLSLKRPPQTVLGIIRALGLAPNGSLLFAAVPQPDHSTGFLVVAEARKPEALGTLAAKVVGEAMVLSNFSRCRIGLSTLETAAARKQMEGKPGPVSVARLARLYPRLTRLRCPSGGRYVVQKGARARCTVHGQHGKATLGTWQAAWKTALTKGLPKRKVKGAIVVGSARLGFVYAVVAGRYVVFGSTPRMVTAALRAYRRGGTAIARGFSQLPKGAIYFHYGLDSYTSRLARLARGGRSYYSRRRNRTLTGIMRSFRRVWGVARSNGRTHTMFARIETRRTRTSAPFFRVKPSRLGGFSLLPAGAWLAASQNMTIPVVSFAAVVLRQMGKTPLALAVRALKLSMGNEASGAMLSTPAGKMFGVLVFSLSRPGEFAENIEDLVSLAKSRGASPPMKKARFGPYPGWLLRGGNRAMAATAIHKNRFVMVLGGDRKVVSRGLVRTIRTMSGKAPSLVRTKRFRSARGAFGKGNFQAYVDLVGIARLARSTPAGRRGSMAAVARAANVLSAMTMSAKNAGGAVLVKMSVTMAGRSRGSGPARTKPVRKKPSPRRP